MRLVSPSEERCRGTVLVVSDGTGDDLLRDWPPTGPRRQGGMAGWRAHGGRRVGMAGTGPLLGQAKGRDLRT